MTIYTKPSITKIPGYYSIQVHPENEVMPVLLAANKLLPLLQSIIWNRCQNVLQPSLPPSPVFPHSEPSENASIEEDYQFELSCMAVNSFQKLLAPCMPPEIIGHMTALAYAEKHFLPLKLTALTPNSFLEMINRVNLCFNNLEFQGFVYRHSDSIVYSDKMPKEKNQATFKLVDQHILKQANDAQKKLWMSTRKKLWDMSFAKEKKSVDFDDSEKALLSGLMVFKPPHHQVPALMDQFAIEFCAKIAAQEDLDRLCSWAHQKLVEIHPYWESNGRTARFLMNLIRMSVGENPLLFDNDTNYTKAVENFGSDDFLIYLQQLKTQPEVDPYLDQCLRSLYETSVTDFKLHELMQKVLNTPFTHFVKRS
jgi:hypothetical protein